MGLPPLASSDVAGFKEIAAKSNGAANVSEPSSRCPLSRWDREGQGEGGLSQEHSTHFRKFQIRFARDDMIRQLHNLLTLGFIADLGPAKNDDDVRSHPFDGGDDLGRFRDVPDVDAEPNDFGFAREQDFRDVERALVDVELRDHRARLQFAQIGEEIAQPERGVNELRVERGEYDVRHP